MKYRSPVRHDISELDKDGVVQAVTLIGFLRSTMKPSARCIKNRVNLWHKIRSISSACLILMLTRIEFTEGSMSTRSFSLRDIVRGFSNTSLEPLLGYQTAPKTEDKGMRSPGLDLWLVVTFDDLGKV